MTQTNRSALVEPLKSILGRVESGIGRVREIFAGQPLGQFGLVVIVLFVLVGVFAPFIAPYEPSQITRGADGQVDRYQPPSVEHPFGTTQYGKDVFSQVVVATRMSLMVGLVTAFIAVVLGTLVGLISGYYGGWIDNLLMRITDFAYGIPYIPFLIVVAIMIDQSLYMIIVGISLIAWRGTARVIRSQVLSLKERPYIETVRAAGASDARIMFRHVLPNVLPLSLLQAAFAVNFAIIAEASLAFLGFGDPTMASWGTIIYDAYQAEALRSGWWWFITPGVALSLLVISVFAIARALERVTNPELQV